MKRNLWHGLLPLWLTLLVACVNQSENKSLKLNDQEYFEMPGLNVMVYDDFYPEGHQGGLSIIQNGIRIAANGDVRLEPTPGQWSPIPKVGERIVDSVNQEIRVHLTYPDSSRHRTGFNPIVYPNLYFQYTVRVQPEGDAVRLFVDLDKPLPEEWVGKVGFNLEFFPGELFGKAYYMDQEPGIFPQQANGPMFEDEDGEYQIEPLAQGRDLVIAPETERLRMHIQNQLDNDLKLIDGRGKHNNGWFIVRSLIPSGTTKEAISWLISPHAIEGWMSDPVVHASQVGYHPDQKKFAVVELDKHDKVISPVKLVKVMPDGQLHQMKSIQPQEWGNFLRYHYLKFDFSEIKEPGMYKVIYGSAETPAFKIDADVYKRHVWQPTLEYFLPVQMCHMRINDRYRVWHGVCHLDDALMAPTDTNHFDGYLQGPSTLTKYEPMEPVPGLNAGGWHDAGDYDLRVESQAGTVYMLALAYEMFNVDYDQTTINQTNKVVEIHQPDGKPDLLQQVEHGVMTILGGYNNLGRLYRGIICPTLRQYVLLGDGSTMTDNLVYDPDLERGEISGDRSGTPDDRWVFTEENPGRAMDVAGGLAAAARVLKGYNDQMARECETVAEKLWQNNEQAGIRQKVKAATELYLTTQNPVYQNYLIQSASEIKNNIEAVGHYIGRVMPLIQDAEFQRVVNGGIRDLKQSIDEQEKETPFGVPYRPNIWGAGWGIQRFGVNAFLLHDGFPEIFPADYALNALNFVLGNHPGENSASFASGIGANSLIVAYGVNRADWSYIPGGVGSGTALIRPDFPELKEWPFFWQQTEYVMGGGATNFMFLVLAADSLFD
ncbi:MAG: glycoside hydrolase family 9 protein [Candidatus Cyclobacteriaceae bacterium M3_2C_046]